MKLSVGSIQVISAPESETTDFMLNCLLNSLDDHQTETLRVNESPGSINDTQAGK